MFIKVIEMILCFVFLISCKQKQELAQVKEAPNDKNKSEIFGVTPIKFSETKKSGSITTELWSGTYWPLSQGGIANRWQKVAKNEGNMYTDYLNEIPTEEIIKNMTQEELNMLSPAEKFDLWQNDKNFTLTKSEHSKLKKFATNQVIPSWMGYCNGWAESVAEHPNSPTLEVEVEIANNKKLKFYPDDIKALWAKFYSSFPSKTKIIGERCRGSYENEKGEIIATSKHTGSNSACRDTNPGSFHLVLNQFINSNKTFIVDVDRKNQVWNHPIIGYEFTNDEIQPIDRKKFKFAASDATHTVKVYNKIKYIKEISPSVDENNRGDFITSDLVVYYLELDKEGKIVGGEWFSSEHDFIRELKFRPDFIWLPKEINDKEKSAIEGAHFSFNNLNKLYERSTSKVNQSKSFDTPTTEKKVEKSKDEEYESINEPAECMSYQSAKKQFLSELEFLRKYDVFIASDTGFDANVKHYKSNTDKTYYEVTIGVQTNVEDADGKGKEYIEKLLTPEQLNVYSVATINDVGLFKKFMICN